MEARHNRDTCAIRGAPSSRRIRVSTERQWEPARHPRPLFAEITHPLEALSFVGQASLVDEERGVDLSRPQRFEYTTVGCNGHDDSVEMTRQQEPEDEACRRRQSGYRNPSTR